MIMEVCSTCGITDDEIEETSKQMGMAFQEVIGAYQNHAFHLDKCGRNWIWISEKEKPLTNA